MLFVSTPNKKFKETHTTTSGIPVIGLQLGLNDLSSYFFVNSSINVFNYLFVINDKLKFQTG